MTEPVGDRRGHTGVAGGGARGEAVYQELILEHYRHPRNKGELPGADVTLAYRNPLCGDELVVQLAMDGRTVREARFGGQGCAISQAAASMLTSALRGGTVDEARALLASYVAMVHGDAAAMADATLGDLRSLSAVARLPARRKCALLAAEAFSAALEELQATRPRPSAPAQG